MVRTLNRSARTLGRRSAQTRTAAASLALAVAIASCSPMTPPPSGAACGQVPLPIIAISEPQSSPDGDMEYVLVQALDDALAHVTVTSFGEDGWYTASVSLEAQDSICLEPSDPNLTGQAALVRIGALAEVSFEPESLDETSSSYAEGQAWVGMGVGTFGVAADSGFPELPARSDDAIMLATVPLGDWFNVGTIVEVSAGSAGGQEVSATAQLRLNFLDASISGEPVDIATLTSASGTDYFFGDVSLR